MVSHLNSNENTNLLCWPVCGYKIDSQAIKYRNTIVTKKYAIFLSLIFHFWKLLKCPPSTTTHTISYHNIQLFVAFLTQTFTQTQAGKCPCFSIMCVFTYHLLLYTFFCGESDKHKEMHKRGHSGGKVKQGCPAFQHGHSLFCRQGCQAALYGP